MIFRGNKVYFLAAYFSDGNIVASAQQFKIYHVLDHMAGIHIPIAKEDIFQADVNDIVFAESFQFLFSFDIEPLDLIEQISFFERVHIKEEQSFVEIKAATDEDNENDNEGKGLTLIRKAENRISTNQAKEKRREANEPRIMKPEAIIGYREYMIGVYEDTSDQLLRKVVEVLRHA